MTAAIEPHKLLIEEHERYLRVEYSGNPLTLAMLATIVNDVGSRIKAGGFERVLIVRDAPLLESDANRAMVAAMIRNTLGTRVCFAIVDIYGNHPVEVRRAAAASRAAGCDLNDFAVEAEAIAWLTTVASDRSGVRS